MSLPTDLMPLPTAPWDERPAELPLDSEEVRTAIWMHRGNITLAAATLKVSSGRLRKFVQASTFLSAEIKEAQEQLVDIAEDNVYDALTDHTDPGRRDSMSRFVIQHLGAARGYNAGKGNSVNINAPKGRVTVVWGDGSSVVADDGDAPGDNAKVVNG